MQPDHDHRMPTGHVRPALLGAVLAGAVACLTWIGSARGTEHFAMQAMHLAQAQAAADTVILSEPPGWQAGDPLAVVIVGGADREALRARLIAELLGARVAVAELLVAPELRDPAFVVEDAYRLLAELAVDRAPGQVLLYGFAWDVGGHAAIAAADPARRMALLGPDGPGFAAHASLGTGCQVATPGWNEPGEWRLHAIHHGEAVWAAGGLDGAGPDVQYSLTALACGMALVPRVLDPDPFARLPARAAR